LGSTLNPSYSGGVQISFSQSLWRNLRVDNTRNQIKIANLNIELNEVQFKQQVTNQIATAQQRYWDLVSAIRNYEIQHGAMRIAQDNLRDQQRRYEVGTIPQIDVTNAEVRVTTQELELISAEDRIEQSQNTLRQLVSSDRNSDIWGRVIVPTDMPDFREYKIDADTAVSIALQNRTELEQSRINMTTTELQNRLSREGRKWDIRLQSSFNLSGTAGQPQRAGFNPDMIGGLPTLYKVMFTDPGTTWSFQFNINVPLKNTALNATLAQQEISKRRILMQRRQTEQDIQVEVRNALQSLESSRRQIISAEASRKVSELQYESEVKRNEAGLSQNYRVLEAMQALSSAEYRELQALISYKQAIITLQRTMNNLLEVSEFSIARGSSSNIPDFQ
jgi:outer membrane protein TolC